MKSTLLKTLLTLSLFVLILFPSGLATMPTATPLTHDVAASPNPNVLLSIADTVSHFGLVDVIVSTLEEPYMIHATTFDTAEALKMGEEDKPDVPLVHVWAPEGTYTYDGNGKIRFLDMHNDVNTAEPPDAMTTITVLDPRNAFVAICNTAAPFVACGNDTEMYSKELDFWQKAGLGPRTGKPAWYMDTAHSQGASLTVLSQKGTSILTDLYAHEESLEAIRRPKWATGYVTAQWLGT